MRVLAVDDDADTLEIFSALLDLWGHEVRAIQNAALALPTALEFRPDLVLLDLGMPEMDGCQIAQSMRQHSVLEGTVLAAVSGYAMEEDRARTRAAGFDLHLAKPVDLGQLKALLGSRLVPSQKPERVAQLR